MSKSIKPEQLSEEIRKALEEYKDVSKEALKKSATKVAREAARTLKATSPVGNHRRHYKDGWAVTVVDETPTSFSLAIHNKSKPGLAHLLEHGHGGPVHARAIVHIAPVEEQAVKDYEDELTRLLENGG